MDRESVQELGRTPHGSSDDPSVLDFSANTNPETPTGVEDVYRDAFAHATTYPAEPPRAFQETAAEYVGCDPVQVVPTPGGLAAIRLALSLAIDPGDTALLPAPGFGEYEREVRLQGGTPVFTDPEAIVTAAPGEHAAVVVCTPNNPTGDGYDRETLLSLADRCRQADTLFLVDEAFLGFTDRESLAGTDGVVVARALTKLFGLPGLRAGFAAATGEWRSDIRAARRTWNLSAPALATGVHCMRQDDFVAETRERVASERERMREALSRRFEMTLSEAPFLLFEADEAGADAILGAADEAGIAVRDARTFRGLDDHLRVAVRRPTENDRLLEALDVRL